MAYPAWSYFPRNVRPPTWAVTLVEIVRECEIKISTTAQTERLSSDNFLKEIGPGLIAQGYLVESGKARSEDF
jgi:hypothetical protein